MMLDNEAKEPGNATIPADLAIVLSGGGARAAYQVGVIRGIVRRFPNLRFPIITGVSAGAINAGFLASHQGSPTEAIENLADIWSHLRIHNVFRVDGATLVLNFLRWSFTLLSGGKPLGHPVRGLVDTRPLAALLKRVLNAGEDGVLPGIAPKIADGSLHALALTGLNYGNGQTVTWVQGHEIRLWERPQRRSVQVDMNVDHIMASAALPLLFPAIRLGNGWYGDGGIRLNAPLSPALHLGAHRVLVISTSYNQTFEEADQPMVVGYPPPAQIIGQLLDAVFLDVIDQDLIRLERLNGLLELLPEEQRKGYSPIDFLVLRPSEDLARIASSYEPQLPAAFRFLLRGLGTRETVSSDLLSMLMFQPDYLKRLVEIGEADAEARIDEIANLMSETSEPHMVAEELVG